MLFAEINLYGVKSNLKEDDSNIPYLEGQHDIFVFQSQYKALKGYLVKVFDLIENLNNKLKSKKSDFNLVFTSSNANFYNEFTERVIALESLQFILDHFQVMKSLILVSTILIFLKKKILIICINLKRK